MTEKKSFVKGAAILSVSGILVKLLGAALRIPLVNKLGDGMAYYNVAYSVYGVFLVLATAGIPVAISRMVSERVAMGNYRGAHTVLCVSLKLMFFLGGLSFCLCFFGADLIAYGVEIPDAALSLKAVAPALCLVPLLSAFRGYFQGQQNMMPTALSETIEQVLRVMTGLGLAFYFFDEGLDVSAAGATFGATAGAVGGIFMMIVVYFSGRDKNPTGVLFKNGLETERDVLKKIMWIAIPIIIGAEIMPLMNAIDTAMIASRLQDTGWTAEEALRLYSQYGAYCDTLISLPQTFTRAIAIGLVPTMAAFYWQKKKKQVQETIELSMRMTMLLACPCVVGLFVLAEPILLTLFPHQAENAIAAAGTLRVMTVGIVFLAISQTTTGVLQAIDRQMLPVCNLLVGAAAKVVVTYVLVGVPVINVKGAAIGSNSAYFTAMILNLLAIKKYTGVKFRLTLTFIKPVSASLAMGVCVYAAANLTGSCLDEGFWRYALVTVAGILVGVLTYVAAIIRLGAVTADELSEVPYVGAALERLFNGRS